MNPWLTIPLSDYEGHMGLLAVDQASALAAQLRLAVLQYKPRSVCILGCAGGNGFRELIDLGVPRIVGMDLNPGYIAEARRRFAERSMCLELYAADVLSPSLAFAPADLIYAALIFEYLDPSALLERAAVLLAPGGRLVAVLQLPSDASPAVTPTPYASLYSLEGVFHFVSPDALAQQASQHGFFCCESSQIALPSGKSFACLVFEKRESR